MDGCRESGRPPDPDYEWPDIVEGVEETFCLRLQCWQLIDPIAAQNSIQLGGLLDTRGDLRMIAEETAARVLHEAGLSNASLVQT